MWKCPVGIRLSSSCPLSLESAGLWLPKAPPLPGHPSRIPKSLTPPSGPKLYRGEVPELRGARAPKLHQRDAWSLRADLHSRVCGRRARVFVCGACVCARAPGCGAGSAPGGRAPRESGRRTRRAARGGAPQCRSSGQRGRTALGPRIRWQAQDPGSA